MIHWAKDLEGGGKSTLTEIRGADGIILFIVNLYHMLVVTLTTQFTPTIALHICIDYNTFVM